MLLTTGFTLRAQHSSALRLKYAINTKKGLAVVIKDIGAGKTTLRAGS
jgi:type II secretory pathway predicted ATPase ExeA